MGDITKPGSNKHTDRKELGRKPSVVARLITKSYYRIVPITVTKHTPIWLIQPMSFQNTGPPLHFKHTFYTMPDIWPIFQKTSLGIDYAHTQLWPFYIVSNLRIQILQNFPIRGIQAQSSTIVVCSRSGLTSTCTNHQGSL